MPRPPTKTTDIPRRVALLVAAMIFSCAISIVVLANADVQVRTTVTDRQPQNTVVPLYPHKARRERLEGSVTVCFDIKPDGKVTAAKVISSTHRWFEKPALEAMRRSTFVPLGLQERPGRIHACRLFNFSLKPVTIEAPIKSH